MFRFFNGPFYHGSIKHDPIGFYDHNFVFIYINIILNKSILWRTKCCQDIISLLLKCLCCKTIMHRGVLMRHVCNKLIYVRKNHVIVLNWHISLVFFISWLIILINHSGTLYSISNGSGQRLLETYLIYTTQK